MNQDLFRFQEMQTMPIYEYRATKEGNCSFCKAGFDRLQNLSDSPITSCPQCQQPVRRVISAPNLGKMDTSLERGNLEKHGFTRYERAEKGVYEKTAGIGPNILEDK
jgi:putative FmdB family regulatory protein